MIPPKIYFFFTIMGIIFVTIHIVLSFKAIRNSMIQRVFIEKKYPNNHTFGPQALYVKERVVYQEDELFITYDLESEYVFYINMNFNHYIMEKIKNNKNNWKEMWKENINLYSDFYSDILFTKSYTIPIEIPPEEIFHFLMVELNSMQAKIQKAVNIILSNSPKV